MQTIEHLKRSAGLLFRGFLLTSFCLGLIGIPNANAKHKDEKNICFRWAFGAMVGDENNRKLIPVAKDAKLKTGDKLKILLKIQKKCYVYLIYHSADDGIYRLFPYDPNQFAADLKTFEKHT